MVLFVNSIQLPVVDVSVLFLSFGYKMHIFLSNIYKVFTLLFMEWVARHEPYKIIIYTNNIQYSLSFYFIFVKNVTQHNKILRKIRLAIFIAYYGCIWKGTSVCAIQYNNIGLWRSEETISWTIKRSAEKCIVIDVARNICCPTMKFGVWHNPRQTESMNYIVYRVSSEYIHQRTPTKSAYFQELYTLILPSTNASTFFFPNPNWFVNYNDEHSWRTMCNMANWFALHILISIINSHKLMVTKIEYTQIQLIVSVQHFDMRNNIR